MTQHSLHLKFHNIYRNHEKKGTNHAHLIERESQRNTYTTTSIMQISYIICRSKR